MPNEFGATLREMRTQLGMSQSQLANTLDTTQRHVSFLETGRSRPGRSMLLRIISELNLSAAQKAALFESSDFRNPYRQRDFASDEVAEALDLIEKRLLLHWPFPAFVMDSGWTILRINAPGAAMFSALATNQNAPMNLFDMFLSPAFRNVVVNWQEASAALYFRLQAASAHAPDLARKFQKAREDGLFDHMADFLTGSDDIPIFVPVTIRHPSGQNLNLTSLMGQLVSVHDAIVEGFEVELMVPTDQSTQDCLMASLPSE